MSMNNKLIVYQADNGAIELKGDIANETVWITQKQLSQVFEVDVRTINEHIKNIFSTSELDEDPVIRKFRITASDGKQYNTNHYNLDMIISVGYRVNSKTATKFRKWATKTLNQHISQGFTINPSRIEQNYANFMQAVDEVKTVLEKNASTVILAHNHPSGDPAPSQADIDITQRIKEALALIDVRVLDHVIIGDGGRFESLAQSGNV